MLTISLVTQGIQVDVIQAAVSEKTPSMPDINFGGLGSLLYFTLLFQNIWGTIAHEVRNQGQIIHSLTE